MRHHDGEIDGVGHGVYGVHIFREGFPIPPQAFMQRSAGDIFDAFHEADQLGAVVFAARRKANPAIAEHRRRHPVID